MSFLNLHQEGYFLVAFDCLSAVNITNNYEQTAFKFYGRVQGGKETSG